MAQDEELCRVGDTIRDRWRVVKKLGEGGFGAVYEVYDMQAQESAALKVESSKEQCQVLKMEVAVLRKLQGKHHICKFYGCGRNDRFNYVVMALVGKNLGDFKRETKDQKFSVSTAIRLSIQCIRSVEDIHSVGFLHRDIKPGNYAMGRGRGARTCFMLDFGLARQYVNPRGEIRTPRAAAGFRGTVRYASINAHKNKDMGRVDDLWCLFYMMVELVAGQVPWRRMTDKDEVGRMKDTIRGPELSKGCPEEYISLFDHFKSLGYADKPDYTYMYGLTDKICRRYRVADNEPYDWEKGASSIERMRPAPAPPSLNERMRFGDEAGGYRGPEANDELGGDPFAGNDGRGRR